MLLFYLFKLLMHSPFEFLIALAVLIFPLLISITVHEWAHGFVAYKFGDPTPKEQGRLSLNPFAHLDPLGTLFLFIVGIGWAKPVEININNIKSKTKQMLVALAGPLSNFLLAILLSIFIVGTLFYIEKNHLNISYLKEAALLFSFIVKINIVLGLFNLLPIPPLDGSNIIRWILPPKIEELYFKLAPYGIIILVILLYTVGFNSIYNFAGKIQLYLYNLINHLLEIIF